MRNPHPDRVEDLHPDEGSLNPGAERYSVNLVQSWCRGTVMNKINKTIEMTKTCCCVHRYKHIIYDT